MLSDRHAVLLVRLEPPRVVRGDHHLRPPVVPAEQRLYPGTARLRVRAVVRLGLGLRIVATEETARTLEVRDPSLLAREVELERRPDLRPTLHLELLELGISSRLAVREDFGATVGVELLPAVDLDVSVVSVDLELGHRLVLLGDLLHRVVAAHDVGEPERRDWEQQLERTHSYDCVAHGPLSFLLPRLGALSDR